MSVLTPYIPMLDRVRPGWDFEGSQLEHEVAGYLNTCASNAFAPSAANVGEFAKFRALVLGRGRLATPVMYTIPAAGPVWQDVAKSTMAVTGDPVGSLYDLSGNGHDWEMSVAANKPTMADRSLSFDGTTERLDTPNLSQGGLIGAGGATFVACVNIASYSNLDRIFISKIPASLTSGIQIVSGKFTDRTTSSISVNPYVGVDTVIINAGEAPSNGPFTFYVNDEVSTPISGWTAADGPSHLFGDPDADLTPVGHLHAAFAYDFDLTAAEVSVFMSISRMMGWRA